MNSSYSLPMVMGALLQAPPWWSRLLVLGGFAFGGATKFLPFQQRELSSQFPFLPCWLWPVVGAWEISIPAFYYLLGLKSIGMHLAFVVIGGIFYAVLTSTQKFPKSHFRKSYGLMLLPGFVFAASSVLICIHDGISLQFTPITLIAGALGGFMITI